MDKKCIIYFILIFLFSVFITSNQSLLAKPTGELTILYDNLGNESADCVKWNTGQSEAIIMSLGEPMVNLYWKASAPDYTPAIASKWKNSPDLKTWEFTIKKGITFHDGTPLTVEDIVYTWNRVLKSPLSIAVSSKRIIKSVEAKDDETVVFHCNYPAPFFLYTVSTYAIQPKAYTEKIGENKFADQPIYAGPWKFIKQIRSDRVEMEAFENHYRKTPYYKNLTLRIVPDDFTKLAMLKAEEGDIIFNVRPGPMVKDIRDNPNFRLLTVPSSNESYMFMTSLVKSTEEPSHFRDKRVRQALSCAIDRDVLIDKLYHGLGASSFVAATMPNSPMMHPSCKPIAYDLEKSKSLLSDAGYPNGFETKIFLSADQKSLAEAISSMWGDIGIKAKLELMEPATLLSGIKNKTLPDGLRISHHSCTATGYWYFFRKNQLYSVIHDDKLDRLTKKMATFPEGPNMYNFIRNEMSQYVYDLVPSIPLVIQEYARGLQPNIDTSEWEKIGTRTIFYAPAAEYIKSK